jgi:hypothetical protein
MMESNRVEVDPSTAMENAPIIVNETPSATKEEEEHRSTHVENVEKSNPSLLPSSSSPTPISTVNNPKVTSELLNQTDEGRTLLVEGAAKSETRQSDVENVTSVTKVADGTYETSSQELPVENAEKKESTKSLIIGSETVTAEVSQAPPHPKLEQATLIAPSNNRLIPTTIPASSINDETFMTETIGEDTLEQLGFREFIRQIRKPEFEALVREVVNYSVTHPIEHGWLFFPGSICLGVVLQRNLLSTNMGYLRSFMTVVYYCSFLVIIWLLQERLTVSSFRLIDPRLRHYSIAQAKLKRKQKSIRLKREQLLRQRKEQEEHEQQQLEEAPSSELSSPFWSTFTSSIDEQKASSAGSLRRFTPEQEAMILTIQTKFFNPQNLQLWNKSRYLCVAENARSGAIRALIARQWKLQETETLIENCLKWREMEQIDVVFDRVIPSDDLEKLHYSLGDGFFGVDFTGHPIWWCPAGSINLNKLKSSSPTAMGNLFWYHIQVMEFNQRVWFRYLSRNLLSSQKKPNSNVEEEQQHGQANLQPSAGSPTTKRQELHSPTRTTVTGKSKIYPNQIPQRSIDEPSTAVYQLTMVLNLKHFGLDIVRGSFWEAFNSIGNVDKDYYYENIYRVYIINAPTVFRFFWKTFSPLFDPDTRAKFQLLDREDELKQYVDVKITPKSFGGKFRGKDSDIIYCKGPTLFAKEFDCFVKFWRDRRIKRNGEEYEIEEEFLASLSTN